MECFLFLLPSLSHINLHRYGQNEVTLELTDLSHIKIIIMWWLFQASNTWRHNHAANQRYTLRLHIQFIAFNTRNGKFHQRWWWQSITNEKSVYGSHSVSHSAYTITHLISEYCMGKWSFVDMHLPRSHRYYSAMLLKLILLTNLIILSKILHRVVRWTPVTTQNIKCQSGTRHWAHVCVEIIIKKSSMSSMPSMVPHSLTSVFE